MDPNAPLDAGPAPSEDVGPADAGTIVDAGFPGNAGAPARTPKETPARCAPSDGGGAAPPANDAYENVKSLTRMSDTEQGTFVGANAGQATDCTTLDLDGVEIDYSIPVPDGSTLQVTVAPVDPTNVDLAVHFRDACAGNYLDGADGRCRRNKPPFSRKVEVRQMHLAHTKPPQRNPSELIEFLKAPKQFAHPPQDRAMRHHFVRGSRRFKSPLLLGRCASGSRR